MTRTSNRTVATATGLGWVLLATAFAFPWLISAHSQPWTTFYPDWAMAVVPLPVLVWATLRGREAWSAGWLGLGTVALAAVPLLQAASGRLIYAGDGRLVAGILIGLALAVMLGRRCEAIATGRLIDALFAGLGMAALLSTGLALYQWVDLGSLGALVLPLPPGGRAVANLGQSNQLAMLLLWGVLAYWWAYLHGRIGAAVAVAAIAFVAVGLVATQSRTGLLGAGLIGAAAIWSTRRSSGRSVRPSTVGAIAVWTSVWVLAWPSINRVMFIDAGLSLAQQTEVGRRPQIWALMFDAVWQAPWFGHGWNQGVVAQTSVLTQHPPLGLVIQHAHNVLLDLMLWNGAVVGLLTVLGLLAWFGSRWRALHRPPTLVLLLLPSLLLMHAMLELPHVQLYFLVPAAIVMGTLDHHARAAVVVALPRVVVAALTCLLTVLALVVMADYRSVETDLMAERIRAARIGDLTPVDPPDPVVLDQLGGVLRSLRIKPEKGLDVEMLAQLDRSARRSPSDAALYRLALASALNGRPDAASRSLQTLCRLYPASICDRALETWRQAALLQPDLRDVVVPDVPGPPHQAP